jgi:hypothetical protein
MGWRPAGASLPCSTRGRFIEPFQVVVGCLSKATRKVGVIASLAWAVDKERLARSPKREEKTRVRPTIKRTRLTTRIRHGKA